jgi:hypothetical protein
MAAPCHPSSQDYQRQLVSSILAGDENVTHSILSFVGDHQYGFIASVNKNFRKVYATLYPKKETYYNVSTNELAKFCLDNMSTKQFKLCAMSANRENPFYLGYLGSVAIDWNEMTNYSAATCGNLNMLHLACANGCPWNGWTCAMLRRRATPHVG